MFFFKQKNNKCYWVFVSKIKITIFEIVFSGNLFIAFGKQFNFSEIF